MGNEKFTPGPWRNCEPGSNYSRGKKFIRPANSDGLIAIVTGEWRQEEKWANARLIAASPELLAALQVLLESSADYEARQQAARDQARAAVAKATGAT